MIQCFRPEDIDQACLSSSDVVAKIILPYEFESMDMLKICRAIHKETKTRNYTLQIFNCYFFSLTIQAFLTRLITQWEDKHFFTSWLSQVAYGIEVLGKPSQTPAALIPTKPNCEPALFRLYSILSPHKCYSNCKRSLLDKLKSKFQRRVDHPDNAQKEFEYRINNLLWHSAIEPSLKQFLEEKVSEVFAGIIKERINAMPLASPDQSQDAKALKVSPKIVTKPHATSKPPSIGSEYIKQRPVHPRKLLPRPKLRARVLSFKGTPTVQTTHKPTMDWSQWVVLCFPYFCLWLLHTIHNMSSVKMLTLGADAILCDSIDEKVEHMLDELERRETIAFPDLESFIDQTSLLIGNPATVWNKNPLTDFYDRVRQHILVDTLNEIEKNNKRIKRCILDRIETHAKDVERAWLGNASIIEIELEYMISQVWKHTPKNRNIDERETNEGVGKTGSGDERPLTTAVAVSPNDNLHLYQTLFYSSPFLHSIHDSSSKIIRASASSEIVRRRLPSQLFPLQRSSSFNSPESDDNTLAIEESRHLNRPAGLSLLSIPSSTIMQYEDKTSYSPSSSIDSLATTQVSASPVSLIMPGSNARTFSLNIGQILDVRPLTPSPGTTRTIPPPHTQTLKSKYKKARPPRNTRQPSPQVEENRQNTSSQTFEVQLSTAPLDGPIPNSDDSE
ncbi:hypothetical protein RSOLAG22IIIB_06210 [Rhizoctonia solani]|uniref:Uncharacterized protein n=1 Tax=Rhizoctonia solani TaxID=456999 RepID=A0A0K6GCW7_9AGAM|nr:hypothetical protein RSOLAG22IIIB_06210 [Rhizoctonia solani]